MKLLSYLLSPGPVHGREAFQSGITLPYSLVGIIIPKLDFAEMNLEACLIVWVGMVFEFDLPPGRRDCCAKRSAHE
eukprot:COSAG06_NODE_1386_length_9618_cov_11.646917_1_plen_75_part_10